MVKAGSGDHLPNDLEAFRKENVRLQALLTERKHMVREIHKSEEALRLALQQVELILDHADDEIVAVDLSGTVIHVNRKME
jgi:PAS domain-containing protein